MTIIDLTPDEIEALRDIKRGSPAVIKTAVRLAEMGLSVFHGGPSELTPAGLAALEAAEKGAKTEADSDPKDGNSDPRADHVEPPLTMISPDVTVISDDMAAALWFSERHHHDRMAATSRLRDDGLLANDEDGWLTITDLGRAALAAWREAKAKKGSPQEEYGGHVGPDGLRMLKAIATGGYVSSVEIGDQLRESGLIKGSNTHPELTDAGRAAIDRMMKQDQGADTRSHERCDECGGTSRYDEEDRDVPPCENCGGAGWSGPRKGADAVFAATPEPAGSGQNSPVDAANPATQPSGNPGQLSMNPCQLPRPAGLSPEMPWPVTPGYYQHVQGGKCWIVGATKDGQMYVENREGDVHMIHRHEIIRPWREPAKFERTWMVFRTNRGKFVHELASVDGEQDEINYRAAEGSTLIARKVVTIAEGEGM